MTERPAYLLVGGEVFDEIVGAPVGRQAAFLRILREIRRNPLSSTKVEIDTARGVEWGSEPALLASSGDVTVSYHVAERYIFLVLVSWI